MLPITVPPGYNAYTVFIPSTPRVGAPQLLTANSAQSGNLNCTPIPSQPLNVVWPCIVDSGLPINQQPATYSSVTPIVAPTVPSVQISRVPTIQELLQIEPPPRPSQPSRSPLSSLFFSGNPILTASDRSNVATSSFLSSTSGSNQQQPFDGTLQFARGLALGTRGGGNTNVMTPNASNVYLDTSTRGHGHHASNGCDNNINGSFADNGVNYGQHIASMHPLTVSSNRILSHGLCTNSHSPISPISPISPLDLRQPSSSAALSASAPPAQPVMDLHGPRSSAPTPSRDGTRTPNENIPPPIPSNVYSEKIMDLSRLTIPDPTSFTIHSNVESRFCPGSESKTKEKPTPLLKSEYKKHADGSFQCLITDPKSGKVCNKKFAHRSSVTRHKHLHHDRVKPFQCPYKDCSLRFGRQHLLKLHLRVHSGEKPYKCPDRNCPKSFKQKAHLTEHIRVHTGEKPYVCNFCGQRFRQKSVLDTHRRRHTGERPFKCKYCAKDFSHYTSYWRHKKNRICLKKMEKNKVLSS